MPNPNKTTYQSYIGGEWVNSSSGETYETFNPAHTSEVVGTFQSCTVEDSEAAIAAAKAAAAGWANMPAPQRGSILLKSLAIMERRGEESRLHLAAEYVDELLTDCRRGTEEPVELPKRMRAREAFEATRRHLPKKPTG